MKLPSPQIFLTLLTALIVAGCATAQVNWDTRVGGFSYDDAVKELGQPNHRETLANGKTVAEWTSRYPVGNTPPDLNNSYYSRSPSFGPSPLEYHESTLRLTFSTNNVLADWSKD